MSDGSEVDRLLADNGGAVPLEPCPLLRESGWAHCNMGLAFWMAMQGAGPDCVAMSIGAGADNRRPDRPASWPTCAYRNL